jgi:hypothetical protein
VFLDRNQLPDLNDSDSDADDSDYEPDGDNVDSEYSSNDDARDNEHANDPNPDDDYSAYAPSDDEDEDLVYDYDDDDDSSDDGIPGVRAGQTDGETAEDANHDADNGSDDANHDADDDSGETAGVGTDGEEEAPGESAGMHTGQEEHIDEEEPPADNAGVATLEQEMSAKYGPRTERYNMRQRKPRDYSHLFATDAREELEVVTVDDAVEDTEEEPLATPQMNMKRGIKVFGQDGIAAVKKEMLQLHDRKVMAPKHAKELTHEQKQEALAYLMFLKRKQCGKIGGVLMEGNNAPTHPGWTQHHRRWLRN